jgi:iron complex transport system permease protein
MSAPLGLAPRRLTIVLACTGAVLLLAVTIGPLVGPTRVDLGRALADSTSPDHDIVFGARLPRTLFAAVAGAFLAASGVSFQAVLRNPLASPFTLGVSGGASLGAVLAIRLGWDRGPGGLAAVPLAALAGALVVVGVVGSLSRARRTPSPVTLLLAGVIVNFVCSALVLVIHYQADLTQSFVMLRWTMGGLDLFGYTPLLSTLPFAAVGLGLMASTLRYLNVLSVGEDWARSRGADVRRLITLQYLGASLLTASVVAHTGPIGFVGLVVPHVLRLLVGADHRLVLPASLLAGGGFLVACDTVARTIFAPVELPVGVVTALLGGPFFLWLLLARRREVFF